MHFLACQKRKIPNKPANTSLESTEPKRNTSFGEIQTVSSIPFVLLQLQEAMDTIIQLRSGRNHTKVKVRKTQKRGVSLRGKESRLAERCVKSCK